MKFASRIYDFFSGHKTLMGLLMVALTAILVCLVLRLRFSENISDFLPLDKQEQEAMDVYQNISGAGRLYILFNNPGDADLTVSAIQFFEDKVFERDSLGWCSDLTMQIDMSQITEVSDFVYANMPYFLDTEDYARMDSLLAQASYLKERLQADRQLLMFPTGPMVSKTIACDPLGLFAPVMQELQKSNPGVGFELYDSYIFTPDMSRAVGMMTSPFGSSETAGNSRLLALLGGVISEMEDAFPGVTAELVGGPEIAVGNSSRIKKDSILAISLSVLLIVLLVSFSIGSLRNILLIFLSIGWGWLFAMAGISIFSGSVSIIVIGISSVILGIAVNYPLHLIVHCSHNPDIKQTLREIAGPLVIGNITTVGAFLSLVPLKAAALRDLGIFASLLLVGTIIFVLSCLPQLVEIKKHKPKGSKLLDRIAALEPDKSRAVIATMTLLTLVLAYFCPKTEFDSNMANINYMTERQRADMEYFQGLLSRSGDPRLRSVYVLSTGADFDEALSENRRIRPLVDSLCAVGKVKSATGVSPFLAPKAEQERRLGLWRDFVSRHSDILGKELERSAKECGFSSRAFAPFRALVDGAESFEPKDMDYFSTLTSLILSGNVTVLDDGRPYVIDVLNVDRDDLESVKECFGSCFDVQSMNSAMANKLSDNFNYIGWACSLIVFFFLWFSFGSFELALISFLPMALSWLWIMGIMALLGIKFNIVNIILATFIFGQGDDYTIFMTEGCQMEYARRKSILASYKNSILQSALIMFVGIGTLIVAKHPAMRSLAEVTITGMLCVVLMSFVIPPLLFRFLTTSKGRTRRYPLTLRSLIFGEPKDAASQVLGRYIYKGKELSRAVRKSLRSVEGECAGLPAEGPLRLKDESYGEKALYIALTHPRLQVTAEIEDEEKRTIARIAAEDFVENLNFVDPTTTAE